MYVAGTRYISNRKYKTPTEIIYIGRFSTTLLIQLLSCHRQWVLERKRSHHVLNSIDKGPHQVTRSIDDDVATSLYLVRMKHMFTCRYLKFSNKNEPAHQLVE